LPPFAVHLHIPPGNPCSPFGFDSSVYQKTIEFAKLCKENKSNRVSLQLFDGPIFMPALDFKKNGIIIIPKIHERMAMHPKTTLPPQPPLALEIKKLEVVLK
jgi:hypothetical protein